MGELIKFPTLVGTPEPDPDPPATSAAVPPVPEPAPVSEQEPVSVPVVHRPDWLGFSRPHRAAARAAVRRRGSRLGRRFWFEFALIPRRVWRLVRWFGRGVAGRRDDTGAWVGGWAGLLTWCLAIRERKDAHAQAAEHPGAELRGTQAADEIALWHTGVLVVPHLAGGIAAHHYLGAWWLTFIPLILATTIYGWRIDPRPPAPLEAPRRGDITVDALNDALRAVGLLDKPTSQRPDPAGVTLARLPRTVGGGQEVVIDLPGSVKADVGDVIRERSRIAASLAVPLPQLVIEPGVHPGQVVLWHSPRDPFAGTPLEHPLLDATRWSVFEGVPFGRDARSRPVTVPVVGTHWLIGAVPDAGKTSAARAVAASVVLDPHAELYVFDGKQGKDWAAVSDLAEVYEIGPIPQQAARLRELLERFLAEGDERFHQLRAMPDEMCPESKLTPGIAAAGMRFRFLVLDEAHRYLADARHGDAITQLLIDYAKGYRACGFSLMLCTQDAGSDIADRFTSLRRVVGTRLALRVMDWQASNMILGDSMNTRGWDASTVLPSQRGTGILRADMEAGGDTGALARMVRCYYMDNPTWKAVCEIGAQLREQRDAAPPEVSPPDEWLTATELLARFRAHAPATLPDGVTDAQSLGEWLTRHGVRATRNTAGQRVRPRALVEAAVGLQTGALAPSGAATVDSPSTSSATQVDTPADTSSDTPQTEDQQ